MRRRLLVLVTLILTLLGSVSAQQRAVTGTVTSASDGLALPGVTVVVKGATSTGTITDADGKYSVNVPKGSETLVFSFVGMATQSVAIGTSNVINVKMEMSTAELGTVVVTALGIKRETKAIGYSIQEVGQADLSGAREVNVENMLTGKVAGLQISKTSSGTGGSSAITIRGAKSLLGNNQPLFVVDGIPISNNGHSGGGQWGDRDYGDGLGDINPEDVENVTVLKGPNASALYGSRGANGVILITTKAGKKKRGIGVEINSNTSMETLNLVPTFQNAYAGGYEETNLYGNWHTINGKSYETMETWLADNFGPPLDGRRTVVDPFVFPKDAFSKTLVLLPQPANNVRDFYNTGFNTANTVAISGGNDNTTARLSIGNATTNGIIPNWKTSKQTIVLNANSQLSELLSFNAKFNYIHDTGDDRPALGAGSDNVTRTFITMGRYVPLPFLKEYYQTTLQAGKWPGVNYNPYYIVNQLTNHDTRDRIIGNMSATLKLASWLSLMGRVGTDFYQTNREQRWPIGSLGSDNSTGRVTNAFGNSRDINADVILTANKALSSKFNLTAFIASSVLYQESSTLQLDGRNFKAPGVYDISNTQDIRPYYYMQRKEMQSVYGSGELVYDNNLYLDVTGRNDWSSALGLNNQSFFYPSVSGSWVVTDALKSLPRDVFSFGKIRASWGQVGNDGDPYQTKNGYFSTTTTYAGQGLSGMNSTLPLFNLKNELTTSWELGTNLRFLNDRINLDFTYYNGKTTNQILNIQVPDASGYSYKTINAGEIDNKGMEVTLDLKPIKTTSGFSWDIIANWSRNHSKVVSLSPGIDAITLDGNALPNNTEARVGQAYGNIVGNAFKRAPDGQKIVLAGGYVATSSPQVLGNVTPKWIGGLNNVFRYKGFTLNVLIDAVQGNQITSFTKYKEEGQGTGVWTTWGRRIHDIDPATGQQTPYVGILPGVNEVTATDGTITYVKNTTATNGQTLWANNNWGNIGEEFVIDGSYIALREVMLSYDFKPSILKHTPFTGLTVSAIGRNLMYFEQHMQGMGIAPESAPNTSAASAGTEVVAMPTTRTWAFNVKLTF